MMEFDARKALVAELIAKLEQMPTPLPEMVAAKEWLREKLLRLRRESGDAKLQASERGLAFADWFRTTLDANAHLTPGWRDIWAKCFDEMVRLDQRTPEQIWKVCQWARGNEFWKGVFLSPLKLRKRDRGNAQYFDRFAAEMAARTAGTSARAAVDEGKQFKENTKARRL